MRCKVLAKDRVSLFTGHTRAKQDAVFGAREASLLPISKPVRRRNIVTGDRASPDDRVTQEIGNGVGLDVRGRAPRRRTLLWGESGVLASRFIARTVRCEKVDQA